MLGLDMRVIWAKGIDYILRSCFLPSNFSPDYSPLQHEIFQEKYGLNMRYHGLGYVSVS